LFALIENLIQRDFHGAGKFFQGINRRDSVAILDARDVAALEAGTLFQFALGEVFFFAKGTQTFRDSHGMPRGGKAAAEALPMEQGSGANGAGVADKTKL